MSSQIVQTRGDGTLDVTASRADKAVLAQLDNAKALDDHGNLQLFVEAWSDEPTFVGALHVIEEFDLEDFPHDQSALEAEYESVYKLFDAIELTLTNKIIRQLNAASEVVQAGGIYSTGWDQRSFGLSFSASAEELDSIREAEQKKAEKEEALREGSYDAGDAREKVACIRRAISHLNNVDFGRHSDDDLNQLVAALTELHQCGIKSRDIDLALRHYTLDPDKAATFIHGPSGRGTNLGARADLTNMADELQHGTSTGELRGAAPKVIIVAGHRYVRVETDDYARMIEAAGKKSKKDKKGTDKPKSKKKVDKGKGGNKTTGPKRTPKDLKGVSKCRAVDNDPKRTPAEQEWCTYDSHGNLRGRHRTKEDAVSHKLFLINMFWTRGKGRYQKNRPTNKPVKNIPRGKK